VADAPAQDTRERPEAQIELALRQLDPSACAIRWRSVRRPDVAAGAAVAPRRNEPAAQAVRREQWTWRWYAGHDGIVPLALKSASPPGLWQYGGRWSSADPERLRELINLVDNAIRYSHKGGQTTVGVTLTDANTRACRSAARTSGEERSRIFERFHRLLGTQTGGSGLGLVIVRRSPPCTARRSCWKEGGSGVGNRFSVLFALSPALHPGATSAG
jgi:two-component system sensor histidine kinase TctE